MDGVRVPVDLLLDPGMTASAKVAWMALRLYPELTKEHRPSPTRLATLTGLSRPTVRTGLARLAATEWYWFTAERQASPQGPQTPPPGEQTPPQERQASCQEGQAAIRREQDSLPQDRPPGRPDSPAISQDPLSSQPSSSGPSGVTRAERLVYSAHSNSQTNLHGSPSKASRRFVTIPKQLLEDHTVRPHAVVLYGVLQATPGFRQRKGRFTCKQLRELTGRAAKTMRRATNLLINRGWLKVTRRNHLHPFTFIVRNPVHEECMAELARVKKRIKRAQFRGEALMKEYLTLAVDSSEFVDDASPGFLVNPFTDEGMELDRYYLNRVAFEFNGLQHHEVTESSTVKEVERQRACDHIKAGICEDRRIRLVVVHAEDLTLKTMIDKIGTSLPLRDLRNRGPVIRYLEKTSRRYREAAFQGTPLSSGEPQALETTTSLVTETGTPIHADGPVSE